MVEPKPSGFKDKYGKMTYDGLPYIGAIYDIREDDPPELKPVPINKVHIKQFNTNSSEALEEWQGILQRVSDGVASISFESKEYDKESKSWIILIRWMDYI